METSVVTPSSDLPVVTPSSELTPAETQTIMASNEPVSQPALNNIAPPKRNVEKSTDTEIVHALKNVVNPVETAREIVIVNTETGFVPDVVHVKKGEFYKIHVVNLNMKEKNTSFLMDSFTQSHNTVYGNLKTFTIEPKLEGVFSYQCPETGVQGRIVVVNEAKNIKTKSKSVRKLASEE